MTEEAFSLLIAHDAGISGDWVVQHIPDDSGTAIADVVESLSARSEKVQASSADVLVVACSDGSDAALDLVSWWVEHRPNHPVVVLCGTSPNGFVQRAFAAGADDLVVLEPGPVVSQETTRSVSFALQKAVARKTKPSARGSAHAALICVLGPKGGTGKTMVAGNLAVSLADRRKRAVIVDLDLQFGDIALSLGLRPERTIYDLSVSGGALDAAKVDAYLTMHSSGVAVLAAPIRPDEAGSITAEFTASVIEALRTTYDYVVIDTPPGFTAEVIAAIDASTFVTMIGMLDALSLKNTRLGLETLELMGYPADRIRVVLNRANSSVGISGQDVIGILGRAPDVLVPSDRAIPRFLNQGEPIVLTQRRSEAAKAFASLADQFVKSAEPAPRTRNGLRLFGRSRG
jgi:pilus assembly protein CpaE